MSPSKSRSPGERAGITQQDVRREAYSLLERHGKEGLTMRALAESLGVAPNAIYSHMTDKIEIIDAVLDDVLGEVWRPDPIADPQSDLSRMMESTYAVLTYHQELAPLYVERRGARGPNARLLGDVILDLLNRMGLSSSAARQARHVLIVYTIGSASYAAAAPLGLSERASNEEHGGTFNAGLKWLLESITRNTS